MFNYFVKRTNKQVLQQNDASRFWLAEIFGLVVHLRAEAHSQSAENLHLIKRSPVGAVKLGCTWQKFPSLSTSSYFIRSLFQGVRPALSPLLQLITSTCHWIVNASCKLQPNIVFAANRSHRSSARSGFSFIGIGLRCLLCTHRVFCLRC